MLTEIPFKRLFVPPPDDQIVTIGWEISNKCNYSCSYCVPELHGGSTPFPESFDPFLKLVDDFRIKSGKRVALDLVGGEPTLWPDLPKFVSACRGRDVLVDMTSNGSRKASWWSEMAPQLNFISLSFHTEFAQRERFEETIDAITQVKSLVAYILALPGEVKKGRELASGWIENNPRLMAMLKPVRKNFGDEFYEYSEEEWQIFRTNSGFCQKGFALAPEVVESRRWLEDENGNT